MSRKTFYFLLEHRDIYQNSLVKKRIILWDEDTEIDTKPIDKKKKKK
jgi:hypothetical protein